MQNLYLLLGFGIRSKDTYTRITQVSPFFILGRLREHLRLWVLQVPFTSQVIFYFFLRRPLATRQRTVYSMKAEMVDDHHLKLHLSTQAGTYPLHIKSVNCF